jgi:hypothetical protein
MRFFVDRCFPAPPCNALIALESGVHKIEFHDTLFKPTTTDVEWLRAVGGWSPQPIVISGDTRILRNPDEQRELVAQDLTFVCLMPGWIGMKPDDFTWKFFKAWPSIKEAVASCKQPTVFELGTGSSLKVEKRDLTRNLAAKK